MKYLVLGLASLLFYSCYNQSAQKTFVAGQVINATDSVVSISLDDQIVERIPLKNDGSFMSSIDVHEEGIYTLSHSPEWQFIYLKPSDSLAFHVNTKEFDESLSFTGSSSAENNFLINMYLMNEKNDDLILSYYKTNPSDYAQKTDSIKETRLDLLSDLNQNHNFSDFFNQIAKSSILYEYYDMRERYAFLMRKYFPERSKEIKPSFFNYRADIDFNDDSMINHIGYLRLLDNYLKNKSIEYCDYSDKSCFTLNSFSNIKRRLGLADSIFSSKLIKNKFYQRLLEEEILHVSSQEQLDQVKGLINSCDLNPSIQNSLMGSAELQAFFLKGRYVGDDAIVSSSLDSIRMIELVRQKPLVIMTWTKHSSAYFEIRKSMISDLKNKYPSIRFIGVNLDQMHPQEWLSSLEQYQLNPKHEYHIDLSKAKIKNNKHLKNHVNRLFMINKKGHLRFSNVSLSDQNLESKLLELINN